MGFILNITEREKGENKAAISPPVAPLRRSVDIVGFNIEEEREGFLVLSWLPSELTKKSAFIKQGFYRSFAKKKATNLGNGLSTESISSNDFNIRPSTNTSTTSKTDSSTGDAGLIPQYWYSVDGEPFEAVPLDVSLEKNRLQVFCTS
ncbi:PREDICTED: uncharacterized protein LOC109582055 [Amphimedon queenslandica]|nr:PREDICTED: uncharacterized protein LOC109582055 [Amphimedon queenslandica]|eukprot:XP_019852178.1 PREDICTED: uncharacterized protein LOC109582055 [Amphimedon queenslandica]